MRAHRTKAMLTQEELAAQAGVSVRHLREIEAGRVTAPRASTVRLLADALGLSDSERAEFQRIARTGPAEAGMTTDAAPAPPGPRTIPAPQIRPAQLPAQVTGFAGRVHQLRDLDGAPNPVVLVVGEAGVGKTTLVIRWAHAAAGSYPDGQLYVNLRGFDPTRSPVDPTDVLHSFLGALGVAASRIPNDRDSRAALYRSLLADRRMLIVLDNAAGTDQVRPLLPGNSACRVLITSRDRLTGLVVSDAAYMLTVPPLDIEEARELLGLRLGSRRVEAESADFDRLIDRCQHLPIALALVAARLAAQPTVTVHALAAQIDAAVPSQVLDSLAVGDTTTDIRAVFSWSYQKLSDGAARLFRLLAVHPGPDISVEAAASLAAVEPARLRPLLDEITRNHLVHEHRPGRYEFHDLLRAYAIELAHSQDAPEEWDEALRRVLDHYIHAAGAGARLLFPHRDEVTVPTGRPGVVRVAPAGRSAALAWFTAEHQVLLNMLDVTVEQGFDAYVAPLAWAFVPFANLRGHWHDELRGHRGALAVAERRKDLAGQGRSHLAMAAVYTRIGETGPAERHYQLALDIFERIGDLVGGGHVHSNLARIREVETRHEAALRHSQEALRLYTKADHPRFRARALSGVGWYQVAVGDYTAALGFCTEALTSLREIGDRDGEAATLDTLGYAHSHLGDHDRAITCYEDARRLHHEDGDRYNEALVLSHLGDSYLALGRSQDTAWAWNTALTILTDLGHPDARSIQCRLETLAQSVHRDLGDVGDDTTST
ncbi:ATP-binding protein [Microbispora siamensis]|uniref:ATP-binding protein n=1 Tax=Microbispora siamensis TaxID=564413 RepID=UPI00194EA631|nr:tetratricopeptide repeat protein [Microbispora siamensis]